MKIELPIHGMCVLIGDKPGNGSIVCSPDLYETCRELQSCCDSYDDEIINCIKYNGAVDGILSMILAHAVAGIDIETPAYLEGIETALNASANNI